MAKSNNVYEQITEAGREGINQLNRLDEASRKFRRSGRRNSIIKASQGNVFEFPVFISSGVPFDYAIASNALLEQIYASYLQFAISVNPIQSVDAIKNGLQFGKLIYYYYYFMSSPKYFGDIFYFSCEIRSAISRNTGAETSFP